jgi:hypothetical protein
MNYKKTLFKIAILNDLLDLELTEIKIDNILDPIIKSKLRNLKKSTKEISKLMDSIFSEPDIQNVFGDFCDKINLNVEKELTEILSEK